MHLLLAGSPPKFGRRRTSNRRRCHHPRILRSSGIRQSSGQGLVRLVHLLRRGLSHQLTLHIPGDSGATLIEESEND